MRSSSQIEALAAGWLARRDSGNFSAADEAELAQWLSSSTANRVAFIRLQAAWQETNRLKVLSGTVPAGQVPNVGEWRSSPYFASASAASAKGEPATDVLVIDGSEASARRPLRRNVTPILRAIAASMLIVAVATVAWIHWPHGSTFRTEIGVSAAVPMTDGSKVTLNTNSRIRVEVSAAERRVDLEQGEAFFEVAKDERRPFVVSAGAARVVALGTKFAVRREGGELHIVVAEGRVRLEHADAHPGIPPAVIAAGDVAHARDDGVLVQEQRPERVAEALSWRHGFLVFHRATLAEAVAELNRYSTREIVIADESIAGFRISGNFRAANGDAFTRLLEDGFPIRAEVGERRIVLHAE